MDLTLFELHLEDASFTAHAPFSGRGDEGIDVDQPEAATGERSLLEDRPAVLPFLIGLTALAALAYLLRRRQNGSTESVTEEPEPTAATR